MRGQHTFCAALSIAIFITGPSISQTVPACEPCVSVDPLPGQVPDQWAGYYSFKEINEDCPNKCGYTRSDDPGSVYCFGSGPRTGEYKCPLTDPTKDISENPTSSMPSGEAQNSQTIGEGQGGLTTGGAQAGQTTGGAQAGQTTGGAQAVRTTGGAQAGQTTGGAQAGQTTGGAQAGQTTGGAQAGQTTGGAQAGQTTVGAQAGLTTDNGEGRSTGSPTVTAASIVSTASSSNEGTATASTGVSGGDSSTGTTKQADTTSGSITSTAPDCASGSLAESCERGWSQSQKKCYKLTTSPFGVNWDDAEAGCKDIGAKLATIESQCDQDKVFELSNKISTWIGGNDKASEGTFVWPNGVEFYKSGAAVAGVFTKLSTAFNSNAQTTQHCVTMKDSGEWDDIVCTKLQNYICEKTAYAGAATFIPPTVKAATTVACSGTCATGWTTVGCNCYKFQDVAKTWQSATDECSSLGTALGKTGRLVSITSLSLEVKLLELSSNSEFWTGGNDKTTQKTFVWDLDGTEFYKDGVEAGYNNWWKTVNVEQPNHGSNQDCVKFRVKLTTGTSTVEKLGWDDVACDKELKYICQYSNL